MAKQRSNSADKRKLSSSEQKLKATIQQLRASEQQLKAANQQLQASEQQFKAANQQLRVEVVERKRAEEQISRQTAVLQAINDVFQQALTCETEEELGKTCLAVAENLTGSKFGFLGELNPAGLMDGIAISNPGWDACKMAVADARRHVKNMPIRGIDRSTIGEGKSRIVNADEMATHPDRCGTPEGHPDITAFLGVPLKHAGKTIGMIGLGNKQGGYVPTDQEAVESLSVAIVEALRYKRAADELGKHHEHLEELVKERTTTLQKEVAEHKKAEEELRASNQQLQANEQELKRLNHNLGERVKELNCLYGLSHLVERRDITLEEIFQGLTELIPPGWQYPEITAARVIFEGRQFKTGNFRKTTWLQSADIKVHGRKAGTIEVCYLKKSPVIDDGPFLREERNLLNNLAERMGSITERKLAEEALKAANQQLQASDQQLKASNQQLGANEQQLRASNQQLRASEQQLRAANQQLQAEVTERKKVEGKIKASLKEKEVLLKEIHHRVKNNMQLISSILNLQSKYVEDEQALAIFKNGQSRIRSMAFVHEKLYESEDLANIDFAEYVHSITHYLFSLHEISPRIRLNVDIKDILLDVNTAIPCALIINELVSNSLKYAFPEGIEGEICIQLSSDKDGKVTLIVEDNGIGFPKDLDFRKTESLGMQLVIMLVEQLEGTVELDKSKGTRFKITF